MPLWNWDSPTGILCDSIQDISLTELWLLLFSGIILLWNRTPNDKKRKVLQLRAEYRDYNLLHFCDCFREEYLNESISYSTVRRILIKERLFSPTQKRKRPRKRFEKEKSGQLLRMDTSPHKWIPVDDRYFNFISIIDNHSRKFL